MVCKITLVSASSWLLVKDSSIDVDKREIEMHLLFSEIIILLVRNMLNTFVLCVSMYSEINSIIRDLFSLVNKKTFENP